MREIAENPSTVCFATAFRLSGKTDLTSFAKTLPEGVVLCDPGIVAGIDHVEAILLQTREYWKRNERLVRNGSIEILMRLSSRGQISEAVEASGIKSANSVALLGLVTTVLEVQNVIDRFLSVFGSVVQDMNLLRLDRQKASKLKKYHGLPSSLSKEDLQVALEERSVLLMFSK